MIMAKPNASINQSHEYMTNRLAVRFFMNSN